MVKVKVYFLYLCEIGMKIVSPTYHVPVLLNECIEGLNIKPEGTYVDVTFGGGGHSRAILKLLKGKGHLYSFDQDRDAIKNCPDDEHFTFVYSNFRFVKNWMRYHGVDGIDGVLADLGVSSHHFDDAARGFSLREDGPLDMRMNQKARMSAADILNNYSAEKLSDVFYLYGELRNSRQIARAITKQREVIPFATTQQLIDVASKYVDYNREKKDMARVFQALRIEVNHEMDALKEMLADVIDLMKPEARLVVLTYHSLEDRIVKNFMRTGNAEGDVKKDFYGNNLTPLQLVNNKVIVPDEKEQNENPRSRSAKLRIAMKKREL